MRKPAMTPLSLSEEGKMIAAVSLMAAPIPNGEAELNAENNFLWPEAVEITKTHQAHLMVVVLGQEEDLLERGKLYVKLLASCCRQKNALGVRGIRMGEQDLVEHAYMLENRIEYVITYREKQVTLNKLKLAKRDTKGTKIRI